MPARDIFHNAARNALIKDGWTITADPLHLRYADTDLYVDLAAEQILAAEKDARRIAVEVKSFGGASDMADLHQAVGQFVVYREVLAASDPERRLYLAIPEAVRAQVFEEGVGALVFRREIQYLVSFDPDAEEVVRWIP